MRPLKPTRSRQKKCYGVLLVGLLSAAVRPALGQEPAGREGAEADSSAASLLRWETLAVGAVLWGSLAGFDTAIRDFTLEHQGTLGDDLSSIGRDFGHWPITGPIFMGGSVLVGLIGDGSVGARRGAAASVGMITGSLANEVINQIVGRRRPAEGFGPLEFDPFHGHSSFGSGHAAFAFSIAGSVDEMTDGWIAAPFYGVAALTALSRVYDDRHWFTDVVVGSFLGYWAGRQGARTAARAFGVDKAPEAAETKSTAWLTRLEPVVSAGFIGVRIRF